MAGRVLIIDDDPLNVKILGDFLGRKGLRVDHAKDGEEAIGQIERHRPDLILLDVLLPKINGLDLCRRVKKAGECPAVFLMSAVYRSPSIQRDAKAEYGADAYFVKPFKLTELWDQIEARLGPERPAAGGTPLEGDLEKIGLPRLLVTLHTAEESGALRLLSGRVERFLYLERGVPIAISSNMRSDRLEQFLADAGVAPEAMADAGERERVARRYVEQRMIECFVMREGAFRFEPGEKTPPELPRAPVPVPHLVLEAVRRQIPLVELAGEIETLRRRVVHARADANATLAGIPLGAEQVRVLDAIDGRSTVEEIIARTGLSGPGAMQTLYGFLLLGVIAVEETEKATGDR